MDVLCRRMTKDDFSESVLVAQKSINDVDGAFYDYVKEMTELLGTETDGFVAIADGKIIGVMYFIMGMHLSGGRTDFLKEISEQTGKDKICTCTIVAVNPEYRGLKISHKLHECAFGLLREKQIHHVLVEIWKRPDGYMPGYNCVHYAPSFTDYGDVPDYYASAPEAEGRVCPVCGEHCRCSAKILVMHI